MTIIRSDLVIFKPELLGDTDQSGGQRTNNKVTSGLLNDLFDPISDIDHAQSAVEIVKCYPALNTLGTEKLIGGHIFISSPPVDPLVTTMIVEAGDLNDNTRMPEMVDILESAVKPGALINGAGPEFVPFQDSFSSKYLTRNESGTSITTYLVVGDIIAITVEYTGNESATYPRLEHICQVTGVSLAVNGVVTFSPAIETLTPGPSISINSQSGCTKIRKTTTVSQLTYHGVKELQTSATLGSIELDVGSTTQQIIPTVPVQYPYSNQVPGDGSRLVTKSAILTATIARTYLFTVPSLLAVGSAKISYRPIVTYTVNTGSGNAVYSNAGMTIGSGTVSVTLTNAPVVGTPITLSYLSNTTYLNHSYVDPVPDDMIIVKNTVNSSIVYNGSRVSCYEEDDAFYIYLGAPTFEYILAGTFNYTTGNFIAASASFSAFQFTSLVSFLNGESNFSFALPFSNPRLDSFNVRVVNLVGTLLSGSSDNLGDIAGTGITGTIVNGVVSLTFSSAVDLSTLVYDVIDIYKTLPPASIFGLDPLRMPTGGTVSVFQKWGVVAIQHSQFQVVASPAPAQVKTIRTNARFADITDANNVSLWTVGNTHFTVDLDAGTVTINSSFPGFTAPFTLVDTIGELGLVANVNTDSLLLASELTRTYPAGSTVASVQNLGDLQAVVGLVRDMTSWGNNWDIDGTAATANLNTAAYPIEVSNAGAINEDWVIIFTTGTAFRLVGKNIGQVATGDTLNDFVPINNVVGEPYFIIRQEAFGGGWSAGEAIRFETFAASRPIMLVRVVESGHSQITTDRALISFRGNEA